MNQSFLQEENKLLLEQNHMFDTIVDTSIQDLKMKIEFMLSNQLLKDETRIFDEDCQKIIDQFHSNQTNESIKNKFPSNILQENNI